MGKFLAEFCATSRWRKDPLSLSLRVQRASLWLWRFTLDFANCINRCSVFRRWRVKRGSALQSPHVVSNKFFLLLGEHLGGFGIFRFSAKGFAPHRHFGISMAANRAAAIDR